MSLRPMQARWFYELEARGGFTEALVLILPFRTITPTGSSRILLMSKRDFYEVLGISKGAGTSEIRDAHRKLVRKLHPDVNKESDASERFAEVQEAYDVLSDETKRSRYDQFGHAGFSASTGTGDHGGAGGAWTDVDPETFESIFGDFFRGRGGSGTEGIDFGGIGGGSPGRRHVAQPRRGSDLQHDITIPFLVAANGGTETIRVADASGKVQSIEVKVPAGIFEGATLRVRGKGGPGTHGGGPGDIRLRMHIDKHPWYKRDGLDLLMDLPITIVEAAKGVTVELPLLSGSVSLVVPPGTGSSAKLRVAGKGITNSKGVSGDFFAIVSIVAPKDLSEANLDRIADAGESLPDPRESLPWQDMIGS